MARTVKMFTREITTTSVVCMVVNTEAAQVENKSFNLSIETTDKEQALKALKKTAETDTMKIVTVISLEQTTKMYGCTVEQFLSVAKELDPETRKPLES